MNTGRHRVLLATFLCICSAVLYAAESEPLGHLIEPGYTPEDAADEQGLWLEIKEYERSLNQ